MSEVKLLPCPFCGGQPYMQSDSDVDGCYWSKVRCRSCGVATRGKWASSSASTCPQWYAEVREEWNARANLAERDAEVEALRAEVLNLEDRCTMLHGSAEYMRARAERLAEALLRYGRHEHDCATRHDAAHKDRPVCDCGLSAALEQENDDA